MAGKTYLVTFPDGETERVTNLSAFCKKYGLSQPGMSKVANCVTTHHQGFFVKIISANENTQLEVLEKRKTEKILEAYNELV